MHVLEIMKQVGHKWQNLNEFERKEYQDKADADKIRYRKELKDFEKEVDGLNLKRNQRNSDRRPRAKNKPNI